MKLLANLLFSSASSLQNLTAVIRAEIIRVYKQKQQKSMEEYVKELDPKSSKKRTIKKTRFGEIMRGLKLGAAYAFDEDAYNRFYPLAKEVGLDVQSADFPQYFSHQLFWRNK